MVRVGLPRLPRRLYDVVHIVLGIPAHFSIDTLRGTDKMRGVACAAFFDSLGKRQPCHFLDFIDDLAHRCAFACTDVECVVRTFVAVKIAHSRHMGIGQVGHVYVIPDTGAVGGRVIVPENRRGKPPLQTVKYHRYKVKNRRVLKLCRAASRNVEIAQRTEADAESAGAGTPHPLAEKLRLPVRVDRDHRDNIFRDNIYRRYAIGRR